LCYEDAMSERGRALLDEVMALEPGERRAIVEELFMRVHEDDDDPEYEAEGIRLAEERLAQVERGEARMIPADEVMKALRR
jgi:hypothetical protein